MKEEWQGIQEKDEEIWRGMIYTRKVNDECREGGREKKSKR